MTTTEPLPGPPELTDAGRHLGRDAERASPPPEGIEEGAKVLPPPPPGAPTGPGQATPVEPRTVPAVLGVMQSKLGIGEPCGRNCNEITRWWGLDSEWCAMAVSYALFHGGFHDGRGRIDIPGVVTTTTRGWAWVPDIISDFRRAGRWDRSPRPGDVFTVRDGGHTGMVRRVSGDVIVTLEGNWSDDLVSIERSIASCDGFGHPPYAGAGQQPGGGTTGGGATGGGPPWPGIYRYLTSPNMQGDDIFTWQQRLRERGWTIGVDGIFGEETDHVCRAFQADRGLEVDGWVGANTWGAAWGPID